jgi:Flp pilus assembly protein TadG
MDRNHPHRANALERKAKRSRFHGERGTVAVEFAIIAPLLIILVLGILEFGFGYHAWDVTQNAAREGARVGAVDGNVSDIIDRVRGTSGILDQDQLQVTVACAPAGGGSFGACAWLEGDIVRVTVVYTYDYITPLPGWVALGDQVVLRSVSEARFEGV